MPDPSPTPGLPNATDALRAVQWVRAASKPVEGLAGAVSLLLAMPRDKRYRMSTLIRVGVPAIAVLMVVNYLFWNWLLPIPILALIVERVLLVALGIAAYVVIQREVARYRAVLEYIAYYGPPIAPTA